MILADGQAVVVGQPPAPRAAASSGWPQIDLFMELLAEAQRSGDRVYFLGARPEVLAKVVTEAERRFPELLVAGAHDGYYPAGTEGDIAEDIRRCRTDMLFLGMSSPRKELFLDEWGAATKAHIVHGVGGSFDIMAGVTKRAPLWLQERGLEWLYRAYQEPVRLGRRYLTPPTWRSSPWLAGRCCAGTGQGGVRDDGRCSRAGVRRPAVGHAGRPGRPPGRRVRRRRGPGQAAGGRRVVRRGRAQRGTG